MTRNMLLYINVALALTTGTTYAQHTRGDIPPDDYNYHKVTSDDNLRFPSNGSHPGYNVHYEDPAKGSRDLDSDVGNGDKSSRDFSTGERQARIIDDGGKSGMAIQGFIPIISLNSQQLNPQVDRNGASYMPQSDYSNGGAYPESTQGYAGPQDAKFLGAAIQKFASKLGGRPKRPYGVYGQFGTYGPDPKSDCICVPFYLCKNGFLRQPRGIGRDSRYSESASQPFSDTGAYGVPPQLSSFYQQEQYMQSASQYNPTPQYNLNSPYNQAPEYNQQYPMVDERSIDGSKTTHRQNETQDAEMTVEGRAIGGGIGGCGVLRTCCRVPPDQRRFELNQGDPYSAYPPKPTYNPYSKPQQNLPFLRPQNQPSYHNYLPVPQIPQPPKIYPSSGLGGLPSYQGTSMYPTKFQKPSYMRPARLATYDQLPSASQLYGSCGSRHAVGVHGRVQNLQYHENSAEFGEYPWQAAILKRLGPADSLFVCGGTLISPLWIATAAHCIKKNGPQDLKVRLGEWDVHREDEFYPYTEKLVEDIIIHPEYFAGNLANDIALLRLDSPVDLSQPHIATACLPDRSEKFDGHRCWVTGWGKDSFGHQGAFQSVLKEVDVPVINNHECEQVLRQTRLGYSYRLHPGFLCAGGEPGKDACEGDGGSGLVCDVRGTWKVVGLVSWGIGCGQAGVPGVYVNMMHYSDWVHGIIGNHYREQGSSYPESNVISERSNGGSSSSNQTNADDFLQKYSIKNFNVTLPSSTTPSSRTLSN